MQENLSFNWVILSHTEKNEMWFMYTHTTIAWEIYTMNVHIHTYRVDDNLQVKIADFGLSRDVYESNYYVLRHAAKLPVRWMALESLLDGCFNLKTDVVC